VDGIKTYPYFIGLDWDFDNQTIIDLKKRQMIFEVADLKVIVPLDPTEGKLHVEPTMGKEINNLYSMTKQMDYYINPTTEGVLSW
jgi:hypothetical protein